MHSNRITRIGVFYDGNYFSHVSDYYRYHHERRARISMQGLNDLLCDEIGKHDQTDSRFCQIVEAHYFRGRFPAEASERHGALLGERKFEDALIKAGVTPHFLLMSSHDNGYGNARVPREKGIDVWLALEAFERAEHLEVVVLITGDGDFVKLVQKLNARGTRSVVTVWDFEADDERTGTRTAQSLIDAVTYPIMMQAVIAERTRRSDPLVEKLFIPRSTQSGEQAGKGGRPAEPGRGDHAHASAAEARPLTAGGRVADPTPNTRNEEAEPENAELPIGQGTVVSLPYDKPYGFIRSDLGGDNLFFHSSAVTGGEFSELENGDRVTFTPGANPRDGRPIATEVSRQSIRK